MVLKDMGNREVSHENIIMIHGQESRNDTFGRINVLSVSFSA